jgi:cell division protein FtsX
MKSLGMAVAVFLLFPFVVLGIILGVAGIGIAVGVMSVNDSLEELFS